MAYFTYKKQGYYINAANGPSITIGGMNPFQFFLQESEGLDEGILAKYINEDEALSKGAFHLSFLHELSHYFQDLSLSSCVSERCFKLYIAKGLLDEFINGESIFPIIKGAFKDQLPETERISPYHMLFDIYNYIFRRNIDGELLGMPVFTYNDILESHAEIRSLFDMYTNESKSSERSQFIHEIISKENKYPIHYDLSKRTIEFEKFDSKYERKYHFIRSFFLRYFYAKQSDFLDIKSNLLTLTIFYEHVIPTYRGGEMEYVMEYSYWVDFYLLLALEIALTIPTPTGIYQYLKKNMSDGKNYEESLGQFIPGIRFFSILKLFHDNPQMFSRDYSIMRCGFASMYDKISEAIGWPFRYNDILLSMREDFQKLNLGNDCLINNLQLMLNIDKGNKNLSFLKDSVLRTFCEYSIPIIIKEREMEYCYEPDFQPRRITFKKQNISSSVKDRFCGYFDHSFVRQMVNNSVRPLYLFYEEIEYLDFTNTILSFLLYGTKKGQAFECPFVANCLHFDENICSKLLIANDIKNIKNRRSCLLIYGMLHLKSRAIDSNMLF